MPHTLTDGCASVALGCVQTGQSIDTLVRVCVPKGETKYYRVERVWERESSHRDRLGSYSSVSAQ
jgi:hypothetical protein